MPYNEINSQTLILNVYDFDRKIFRLDFLILPHKGFGKHDQIGQVSVPLGKVDLATTIERTVPIEAPPVNLHFTFWQSQNSF